MSDRPEFGISFVPSWENPAEALRLTQLADERGYDLVGIQDHPYQWRFLDTWTLISWLAAQTARIRFFPDVANLPLRPPAVLAKAAASLDVLTGGRIELGLGAGWAWDAIEAMGGPRRSPAEAVGAAEEGIDVIRLVWTGAHNRRYDGRFYRLAGVNAGPKPAHPIGIWIGAYGRPHAGPDRAEGRWLGSLGQTRRIGDTAGRDPQDRGCRGEGGPRSEGHPSCSQHRRSDRGSATRAVRRTGDVLG